MNTGTLRDWERRLRRLESANPLSHSSLGRGRMRFYDGSELLIENGALNVTGSARISGILDVTGTTNLKGQTSVTGPMEISGTTNITGNTNIMGELNVTGPTTLDGITDIGGDTTITGLLDVTGDTTISGQLDVTGPMATKGTLSVEGVTTLKNDLNVTEGGKIKAGNLEIEPAGGGQINFSGGSLSVGLGGLFMNHTQGIKIFAPVVEISTQLKPASELTPLGVDSNGGIYRIIQ